MFTGVAVELDAGNRIFTTLPVVPVIQGEINMEPPASAPDLVVQTPSVSDASLVAGESFTLSAVVRNEGDETSATTTLRYYRSSGRDDFGQRYASRHGHSERTFRFWSQ